MRSFFPASVGIVLVSLWACSSEVVAPLDPPTATVPPFAHVPQPAGYDISDIKAIFLDLSAPSKEVVHGCDADFQKLLKLSQSEEERKEGALELVRSDPVAYHWCFYGKLIELEDGLGPDTYVDVRQKHVLDTYAFLTPVARAYMIAFHDSRYMRWAIRHYRKISEWIFFRKLELTPDETSELADVSNPFGAWRDGGTDPHENSVLEKYSLVKAGTPTIQTVHEAPHDPENREPAGLVPPSEPTPLAPSATPVSVPSPAPSEPEEASPSPFPSASATPSPQG